MTARSIVLTLVLSLSGMSACLAADGNMGTWKMNAAKSTFTAAAPRNNTVVYSAAGDMIKVTVDGMTADGKPIHSEWTGKFDDKDYPVTGDPTTDTRSYHKIDDRTMELILKKDGKVTGSARIVLAADGKSRTLNLSVPDAQGNKTNSRVVYDKQ